ncbi:hypothetical protein GCM10023201_52720 [Actinomycetospora corticicola]|uniref:Uncharacterized protein n=1 Tax=Actinomycetospora corticicola TaxID=663602 RepID=A0A7Y9J7J1_9PSEU|nr:hypothetical protein [Actinomycetospora corticicola]NYD37464.1 hypothetical protein [Actinomycetospora corticicola]
MGSEDDRPGRQATVDALFWSLVEATQADADQQLIEEIELGFSPRPPRAPVVTAEQERLLREGLCSPDEPDDLS